MEKIVIEIISKLSNMEVFEISKNTLFEEDLKFDYLDISELFMNVEDKLKIVIIEDECSNMKTVGEFLTYVQKKLKSNNSIKTERENEKNSRNNYKE